MSIIRVSKSKMIPNLLKNKVHSPRVKLIHKTLSKEYFKIRKVKNYCKNRKTMALILSIYRFKHLLSKVRDGSMSFLRKSK
jgi:hypothetical protein